MEHEHAQTDAAPHAIEAALCEAFRNRTPGADEEMVAALAPRLRETVRHRWPSLWPELPELSQGAFLRLFECRRDDPDRVRPTLRELAAAMLVPVAKMLRRRRDGILSREWDRPTDATQEAAFRLRRISQLVARLPKRHAVALLAHHAHETGEGPPLAQALGLDERQAHRRLVDAQRALALKVDKLELERKP